MTGLLWFLLCILICIVVVAISSPFTFSRITATEIEHTLPGSMRFKVKPYTLQVVVQKQLDGLFVKLCASLNRHGIGFWVVKSTLLGLMRHKQRIPWCDVYEIAIMYDDLPRLVSLRMELEQSEEFRLLSTPTGYTFALRGVVPYPAVTIDIMQQTDIEVSVCTPLDELGNCSFTHAYDRRRDVFPTSTIMPLSCGVDFKVVHIPESTTVKVNVPYHPERCLEVLYGPDWRTEVRQGSWPFVWNRYTRTLLRMVGSYRPTMV
jgi:hypothetical protein